MAGAAKGQPPGQEAAAAHWPGTSPVPGASLGAAWAGKGSAPRFSLPPPLSHRQPEQSGRQASQLPFTLPQARTQAPRELTAQLQSEPAGRQPGPGVALGCFLETPTSSGPGRQLCTKEAGNKTETPPPPSFLSLSSLLRQKAGTEPGQCSLALQDGLGPHPLQQPPLANISARCLFTHRTQAGPGSYSSPTFLGTVPTYP